MMAVSMGSERDAVEVKLDAATIEMVMSQWEEENPGKDAMKDMGPDEFSRRMMAEMFARARTIPS